MRPRRVTVAEVESWWSPEPSIPTTSIHGYFRATNYARARAKHEIESRSERCANEGIEITRGLAIDEIALGIALPGLDQRHVGHQSLLEHVSLPVDDPRFLTLGDQRARAYLGVKP